MRFRPPLPPRIWIPLLLAGLAGSFGPMALAKKTPKPVIKAVDKTQALAQWAKVYAVFSHPRCANCHVGTDNRPRWSGAHYKYSFGVDQDWGFHAMFIHGGEAKEPGGIRDGAGSMACNTCHMQQNSPIHHGPPGAPIWALAPVEMEWWRKSSPQICEQIKDPARNGKRSIEEVAAHIEHDALVQWGWAPGPGRQPAPHSAQETALALRIWAASGAPCPPSSASTK